MKSTWLRPVSGIRGRNFTRNSCTNTGSVLGDAAVYSPYSRTYRMFPIFAETPNCFDFPLFSPGIPRNVACVDEEEVVSKCQRLTLRTTNNRARKQSKPLSAGPARIRLDVTADSSPCFPSRAVPPHAVPLPTRAIANHPPAEPHANARPTGLGSRSAGHDSDVQLS